MELLTKDKDKKEPILWYVLRAIFGKETEVQRKLDQRNKDIKDIDLSISRFFKDFGRGFYLSADEEQAFKIAQTRVLGFGGEPKVS